MTVDILDSEVVDQEFEEVLVKSALCKLRCVKPCECPGLVDGRGVPTQKGHNLLLAEVIQSCATLLSTPDLSGRMSMDHLVMGWALPRSLCRITESLPCFSRLFIASNAPCHPSFRSLTLMA